MAAADNNDDDDSLVVLFDDLKIKPDGEEKEDFYIHFDVLHGSSPLVARRINSFMLRQNAFDPLCMSLSGSHSLSGSLTLVSIEEEVNLSRRQITYAPGFYFIMCFTNSLFFTSLT